MRVSVDVEGVDETLRDLKLSSARALVKADRALENAVRTITEPLAKNLCPVDTGKLRKSIRTEWKGWGVVELGTDVYYGKYQEFGFYISEEFARHAAWGRGMPELVGKFIMRPFLRPAILITKDLVNEKIQDSVSSLER